MGDPVTDVFRNAGRWLQSVHNRAFPALIWPPVSGPPALR